MDTNLKSRIRIIIACCLAALSLVTLFNVIGYKNTWEIWNIPTMSPNFSDLRVITHGAESYSRGFDPLIANPSDPWQRRLNYPRIWQSLYFIGINQSHTTYIGVFLIFLFFAGVCLTLPHSSYLLIMLVMGAVLSPATLLGFERGNIDLLIFFLAAFSIATIQKGYKLPVLAILAGIVLKLYPIFGCAILLRLGKSVFEKCIFAILSLCVVYILATYSDMILIREATPNPTWLSYGLNVFWMSISNHSPALGIYAKWLSYLIASLAIAFALFSLTRVDRLPAVESEAIHLDAFRVGASIYIGTFLLNNNFDYRLIFLIFTIPQLMRWIKSSKPKISIISSIVLATLYISMWNLLITKALATLPYGNYTSFFTSQMSMWVTFSGLLFLLFWSMPQWVKEFFTRKYSLFSRPSK